MKISVVLATYNGAQHIVEQLDSIIQQTMCPSEIVISDDCPTDSTIELARKTLMSFSGDVIILENVNNVGYSQNFFRALNECKGEIVFFSDQDDFWFPNKISEMVNFILNREKSVGVAINDTYFANENMKSTNVTKLSRILKLYGSDKNFIAGCCTVIDFRLLKFFIPFPTGYSYDEWIHFVGREFAGRDVLKLPLQMYRRHSSNTSNTEFNVSSSEEFSFFQMFVIKMRNFSVQRKINYLIKEIHGFRILRLYYFEYVKKQEGVLNYRLLLYWELKLIINRIALASYRLIR
jgi:glycosyltransferase involved in cell wall biosynthesis